MKYKVTLDVTTVFYTDIEANTEEEAVEMAKTEAYQDTWGSEAIYSGVELVEIEEDNL